MPAFWDFSWWWCAIPMLFMGVAMGAFFFLMSRRGGCGCMGSGSGGGRERTPPGNPG